MEVMGVLKRGKVWIKSVLSTVVKAILSVGYINGLGLGENWGFTQI